CQVGAAGGKARRPKFTGHDRGRKRDCRQKRPAKRWASRGFLERQAINFEPPRAAQDFYEAPHSRMSLLRFVGRVGVELTVFFLADRGEQVELRLQEIDMAFLVGKQVLK